MVVLLELPCPNHKAAHKHTVLMVGSIYVILEIRKTLAQGLSGPLNLFKIGLLFAAWGGAQSAC